MKTEVLIVGAGPYGISLAYELYCRKIPFAVAGIPFSLWFRHVLSSVSLRSDFRASSVYSRDGRFALPRFLRAAYSPARVREIVSGRIPVRVFREYLRWVRSRLPFPIFEEKVTRLEKRDGGFEAVTESGTRIESKKTALAAGVENHRRMPECLAELGEGVVCHGWDVPRYEHLEGKKILAVGGGQSGAEAAVWLSRRNEVTWAHRSPLVYFSEPINLPKPLFDAALRLSPLFYRMPRPLSSLLGKKFVQATVTPELKPELESGKIRRLEMDAARLGLERRGVAVFSSLLGEKFDRVVSATGYRHDLRSLGFLSEQLLRGIAARDGVPALTRRYETSVRGLFAVGGLAEPSHGPALRFMFGCRDAVTQAGRGLAS